MSSCLDHLSVAARRVPAIQRATEGLQLKIYVLQTLIKRTVIGREEKKSCVKR